MFAFATQHPSLGGADGLCERASWLQWVALSAITCSSFGGAIAAGFDDIGAFNTVRSNTPGSVIGNESRPKNLAVASASAAMGVKAVALDDADSSLCNEKRQPLCRDLAASEFQVTSLRFMLPEVRGLSAKSLNIRRNSVSATYTFR